MSKIKKSLLMAGIVIIVVLLSYFTWHKMKGSAEDDAGIIFFYGTECSHCQAVEKYIADNQIDQKVSFSKREVSSDSKNANLMVKKAMECNIDTKTLGIPFMWANGKCYMGDNEVENFLNEEVKKGGSNQQEQQ